MPTSFQIDSYPQVFPPTSRARKMCKLIIRYIILAYTLLAVICTTTSLLFCALERLRVRSHPKPLTSLAWTSNGLVHEDRLEIGSEMFSSKAFSSALKPTKIIPYYYRAMHEHEENDVTITTIVTSNRFQALARLVEQYQGKSVASSKSTLLCFFPLAEGLF